MAQLNEEQKAELRQLAQRYELKGHHFHADRRGFIIVTRAGVEQIAAKLGILYDLEPVYEWCDAEKARYVIRCKAWMPLKDGQHAQVQSYGEVSAKNNSNAYPVAMAEKRALSRSVLKLAGMYKLNVYGEDEIPTETPTK